MMKCSEIYMFNTQDSIKTETDASGVRTINNNVIYSVKIHSIHSVQCTHIQL